MMERLLDRAAAIGRAAQLQRLERIAAAFRSQGLAADIGGDSIAVRGHKLAARRRDARRSRVADRRRIPAPWFS